MVERLIFVSYGLLTDAERSLGAKLAAVVEANGRIPFVAQEVHSGSDLNSNVFEAVKMCDAFLGILQKRGTVTFTGYPPAERSSVLNQMTQLTSSLSTLISGICSWRRHLRPTKRIEDSIRPSTSSRSAATEDVSAARARAAAALSAAAPIRPVLGDLAGSSRWSRLPSLPRGRLVRLLRRQGLVRRHAPAERRRRPGRAHASVAHGAGLASLS